ncbi:uncharacterized protein JCM10292_001598 [Rhodotorula paludigena]|uniref:uncharacterized protein n=1 Tax=Rhodotorula paludigena TaxID=86838 RepID=UPI00316F0507
MATTFPPPPAGSRASRAPRPPRRDRDAAAGGSAGDVSLADIFADVSSQAEAGPSRFAGPPAAARRGPVFPSVSRAQREEARRIRLSASPEPVAAAQASSSTTTPFSPPQSAHALPPSRPTGIEALLSAANEDDTADAHRLERERERQVKLELASAGPFDNRRPSYLDGGSGSEMPAPVKGVGAGGSGGTKRRHRDVDRTNWDAASELVMQEREREKALRGWKGKARAETLSPTPGVSDREKTPTPVMALSAKPLSPPAANGETMAVDGATPPAPSESPEMDDGRRPSKAPSLASAAAEDDDMMDDDASIMTGMTNATGVSAGGADGSGEEPAKKRSRTLTTPAQTAVLNALLAKTRFPSTETREEVGKQIGMSARRVQIWFQNRRQSQKRQRDREAQEQAAAQAAAQAAMAAGHALPYPSHGHIQAYADPAFGPTTAYYPPYQPKQPADGFTSSRPELHRHVSGESLASRHSFALNHSRAGRDGLPQPPSDARYAHPYGNGGFAYPPQAAHHSNAYPQHLQQSHGVAPIPSKLYFPHVQRSHAPPSRVQAQMPMDSLRFGLTSPVSGAGGFDQKLPSLSSVLGGVSAGPQTHVPASMPVQHQPMFSHSPFSPPAPSHANIPSVSSHQAHNEQTAQAPPSFARALLSPEPASSFERLRISGGPMSPPPAAATSSFSSVTSPLLPTSTVPTTPAASQHGGMANQADLLDAAMETMAYRSQGRTLPARQMLPPLRSVLGEGPLSAQRPKKGGPSEADKALLAPIASGSGLSSARGPPTLAPIQTFAPLSAPPGSTSFAHSKDSSPVSPRSQPPSAPPIPAPSAALSPQDGPSNGTSGRSEPAANGLGASRASTWSEVSHATRSSAASFEFGAAPMGSYRDSTSTTGAWQAGASTPTSATTPVAGPAKSAAAGDGSGREQPRAERGASVGTEETSSRTSLSSEGGGGIKA